MTFAYGPTTNRRRLRVALRRIRESRCLTLEDVRTKMEWSLSKLIRIESGTVSISVNDLKVLLQLYGVTDAGDVERLLELARRSRQRHWAGEYRDIATPAYMDFLGYEDDAARITQYHPLVIPGLLQTREYAHEIVTATTIGRADADVIEGRVQLRMARQGRFFGGGRDRLARFVIPESVLTTPMGQEVDEKQRTHLVEMAGSPRVQILVLKNDADTARRFLGPFSLHEFQSELDPDVVYLDSAPADDVALVEDARVNDYKVVIGELLRKSLDEKQSQVFLAKLNG